MDSIAEGAAELAGVLLARMQLMGCVEVDAAGAGVGTAAPGTGPVRGGGMVRRNYLLQHHAGQRVSQWLCFGLPLHVNK